MEKKTRKEIRKSDDTLGLLVQTLDKVITLVDWAKKCRPLQGHPNLWKKSSVLATAGG